MSEPKNCHYLSRSLTKPWECENTRKLRVYDFNENKIVEHSSKTYFSRDSLLTKEEEHFFRDYIESPLGMYKSTLIGSGETSNWKIWRALHMYIIFQTARISLLKSDRSYMDQLIGMSEEEIDLITYKRFEQNNILELPIDNSKFLCVPEIGFFGFLIPSLKRSNSIFERINIVPITPSNALIVAPKSVTKEQLLSIRELIPQLSVGPSSDHNKVIIPYSLDARDEEIIDYLNKTKSGLDGIFKEILNFEYELKHILRNE
ncbi:hypothetical protein M902_0387 [Bacteriovorax sp. BAL6_X]|uniref:hypothetical protein n=1 Tax=Bacteriovorax sp. BAL6_X TaxID=1201290 RepID=UPI000385CFFC|nr:hypothetical protein [Bacteriovorax sp. BAL6_X]EPZ50032.1 hypothetical protein M902_0387 [Bacteriovorax sp. BAL6_X]